MKDVKVDEDNLQNVLKVLDLVINFKKKKAKGSFKSSGDIYCASTSFPKYKRVINQCIDLVIKCIASHRYKEVVNLLWILTQDKCINMPFLSKTIMIVLLNTELNTKVESMWSCIQALQDFKTVYKREILLEYMMYTLKSDMYDVQRLEDEIRKRALIKKYDKIESIFEAYMAMAEYIEGLKQSGDMLSQSQSAGQKSKLVFEKLIKETGNWDIFILKLIKIVHRDNEETTLEELLLTYVNSNSENINAYIYFCTYLYYYNPESQNLEKYLKIIADMDPSNVRVLWLLDIWTRQKIELTTRLKYIFMFLDYPSNRKNITAWRILKQNLSEVTANEIKENIMQTLWVTRCRSWEWMHFNPHNNLELDLENKDLVLEKVDVLSFFFHKHKFIKKAKKIFPDIKKEISLH